MKTYMRFKQRKHRLQNIKQIEPQQKYRLGTISNILVKKVRDQTLNDAFLGLSIINQGLVYTVD